MTNKFFYRFINYYDEIKKKYFPQVSGTFIQPDMVMDWDDLKWQRELSYLKEVRMKYIVMNTFIVQNQHVRRIYKTSIKNGSKIGAYDVVDMCLRNCEKAGFKVFLGIDYNSGWWKIGPKNSKWLYTQMKNGNLVVEELYKKYHEKYKNAFYGWYWVYEVDNLNFKSRKDFKILANAVNINLSYMESNNARLPLMISPFMNSKYSTPQIYADNWRYFFKFVNFKKGDIFCPQDSVGGGGLHITEVKDWFSALGKAVKSRKEILFWANIETFDHTDWSSAPIKRFIKQMRSENEFVDDMITFSYSHYYSPNNINGGFHRAYRRYLYQHEIHDKKPDPPKWIKVEEVNNKDLIKWETTKNAAGYKLYCNGKEIYSSSVQRKYGGDKKQLLGQFICRSSSKKFKYEVRTVDFWGNMSKKIMAKRV
ncbi:DUF4434 domain-containing protein [Clostridium luticellarii]|jgi:hypothetical protein|uniref:DUF4434 domain-containing protein n=1 Tax=Clostridium luticellarii TaxID=1691940 RepID=A0A2T0BGQ2_9CLOT|nr:DUF4434 domain-containing protein [Clostridium luticellarii]MCI1943958.1 DUF4434 domain-containing protein [Clostridium luticellarii]MCI1967219.1 DUF4434 domain-containing protein [Clostridium luticellarii]MCI1995950.1 DUF4434 domain-containing protein [Clostridium luticellarii]MCI2038461.1 DUF4434 domain-containing protein [Clostridium luticellarii]PRR83080.1 hypothetical protein CLLU_27000 [Clostridium luticellarii]